MSFPTALTPFFFFLRGWSDGGLELVEFLVLLGFIFLGCWFLARSAIRIMRASQARSASPPGVSCLAVSFLSTTSHPRSLPNPLLFLLLLAFSAPAATASDPASAPAPAPAPTATAAAAAAAAAAAVAATAAASLFCSAAESEPCRRRVAILCCRFFPAA